MAHGPHVRVPTHRRGVTTPAARLATEPQAGSPLAGRVSHPLDDKRSFMKSSHAPLPFDQPVLVALKFRFSRVLYTTYNCAAVGDHRARYYADKRKSCPPDCERDSDTLPSSSAKFSNPTLCLMIRSLTMKHEGYLYGFGGWFVSPSEPVTLTFSSQVSDQVGITAPGLSTSGDYEVRSLGAGPIGSE